MIPTPEQLPFLGTIGLTIVLVVQVIANAWTKNKEREAKIKEQELHSVDHTEIANAIHQHTKAVTELVVEMRHFFKFKNN